LCQPEPPELLPQLLEVLLHPILDDVGAVPHLAQVGIDPADHLLRAMASSRLTV